MNFYILYAYVHVLVCMVNVSMCSFVFQIHDISMCKVRVHIMYVECVYTSVSIHVCRMCVCTSVVAGLKLVFSSQLLFAVVMYREFFFRLTLHNVSCRHTDSNTHSLSLSISLA
jgi:hypothetical protein